MAFRFDCRWYFLSQTFELFCCIWRYYLAFEISYIEYLPSYELGNVLVQVWSWYRLPVKKKNILIGNNAWNVISERDIKPHFNHTLYEVNKKALKTYNNWSFWKYCKRKKVFYTRQKLIIHTSQLTWLR